MRPLIISALLAASAVAAEPTISIHTQLCELPADTKLPHDLTQIAKVPKADILSVPDSSTYSGESAKVSVSREFTVPGKGTFPTGIFLSIRPTVAGDGINYSVDFERTEFVSFAPRSATHAPVLDTQKIVGIDGKCASGTPVWLDLGVREDKQLIEERGKPNRTRIVRTRLIAILTFSEA